MLQALASRAARAPAASLARRAMSTTGTVDLAGKFQAHNCDLPAETATVDKDELFHAFKQMYTIRRMEISCDTEYKARNIRGFCHLSDGQEAIPVGMDAALTHDDGLITS